MQAYSNVAPLFNLPEQLIFTVGEWTLEQRKARLRARNPNFTTGWSLKRRDAAELNVRDVLAWVTALLHEEPITRRVKHRPLVGARGLYTRLGRCGPGMLDLRAKIRAGVSWLVEHGPASGWGVPNPDADGESTSNFTPYYIPRANLYAAERWVRVARKVGDLVRLFVALLSKVSPAPRGQEERTAQPRQAVPVHSREVDNTYGVQDSPSRPRGAGPPHRDTCKCDGCRAAESWLRSQGSGPMPWLDELRRRHGEGGEHEH